MYRTLRLLLIGFLSWAGAASLSADPAVVLVEGGNYGHLEIKALATHLLQRELPEVPFEEHGELLPAADFGKYSLVVLAGAPGSLRYTAEEVPQIEEWVQNGGRLLLIGQAPNAFIPEGGAAPRESTFPHGRSHYFQTPLLTTIHEPAAPLLEGVVAEGEAPFWLTASVMLYSGEWENLIGTEKHLLVGRRKSGQGAVYYVGSELFRIMDKAKTENADDAERWIRLLRNIFTDKPLDSATGS